MYGSVEVRKTSQRGRRALSGAEACLTFEIIASAAMQVSSRHPHYQRYAAVSTFVDSDGSC